MTEYLSDIPAWAWMLAGAALATWVIGGVWMAVDIARNRILPDKGAFYLIAIFWPFAGIGLAVLAAGGLVWVVAKNLAVEAWDVIKGIFEKESV